MRHFYMSLLSNVGRKRNKILHKVSLVGEDDAQTSNTRIAQRKRTIPHSTMEKYDNIHIIEHHIIECCNNTHQGASHTGQQTSACTLDLGDSSYVTCYCNMVKMQHDVLKLCQELHDLDIKKLKQNYLDWYTSSVCGNW